MTPEVAETYALKVLGWLVGEEEILPILMGSSGSSAADIKERAQDADFLIAVLDFVMMDDAWVLACCQACALEPEAMQIARQSLPGGGMVNWT